MAQDIRAIYEHGQLRLLDPVILSEGEQVHVKIISARERAREVLGDLLVPPSEVVAPDLDAELDEDALMRELDAASQGVKPLSLVIIEERREGP